MSCGEEDEDEDEEEEEESSDDDSTVQQAGSAAESSASPIDQQHMDEVLRTFRMLSEAGVPVSGEPRAPGAAAAVVQF